MIPSPLHCLLWSYLLECLYIMEKIYEVFSSHCRTYFKQSALHLMCVSFSVRHFGNVFTIKLVKMFEINKMGLSEEPLYTVVRGNKPLSLIFRRTVSENNVRSIDDSKNSSKTKVQVFSNEAEFALDTLVKRDPIVSDSETIGNFRTQSEEKRVAIETERNSVILCQTKEGSIYTKPHEYNVISIANDNENAKITDDLIVNNTTIKNSSSHSSPSSVQPISETHLTKFEPLESNQSAHIDDTSVVNNIIVSRDFNEKLPIGDNRLVDLISSKNLPSEFNSHIRNDLSLLINSELDFHSEISILSPNDQLPKIHDDFSEKCAKTDSGKLLPYQDSNIYSHSKDLYNHDNKLPSCISKEIISTQISVVEASENVKCDVPEVSNSCKKSTVANGEFTNNANSDLHFEYSSPLNLSNVGNSVSIMPECTSVKFIGDQCKNSLVQNNLENSSTGNEIFGENNLSKASTNSLICDSERYLANSESAVPDYSNVISAANSHVDGTLQGSVYLQQSSKSDVVNISMTSSVADCTTAGCQGYMDSSSKCPDTNDSCSKQSESNVLFAKHIDFNFDHSTEQQSVLNYGSTEQQQSILKRIITGYNSAENDTSSKCLNVLQNTSVCENFDSFSNKANTDKLTENCNLLSKASNIRSVIDILDESHKGIDDSPTDSIFSETEEDFNSSISIPTLLKNLGDTDCNTEENTRIGTENTKLAIFQTSSKTECTDQISQVSENNVIHSLLNKIKESNESCSKNAVIINSSIETKAISIVKSPMKSVAHKKDEEQCEYSNQLEQIVTTALKSVGVDSSNKILTTNINLSYREPDNQDCVDLSKKIDIEPDIITEKNPPNVLPKNCQLTNEQLVVDLRKDVPPIMKSPDVLAVDDTNCTMRVTSDSFSSVRSPSLFSSEDDMFNFENSPLHQSTEDYLSKTRERMISLQHKRLSSLHELMMGLPPPPSVTNPQFTLQEVLDLLQNNSHLMFDQPITETKPGKWIDKMPQSTCGDACSLEWPFVRYCDYFDVWYNLSEISDRIDRMYQKMQSRFIACETSSTFVNDASANCYSKRLRRISNTQSPGGRLSHLAKRRQTFTTDDIQMNSAGRLPNNLPPSAVLEKRLIMIDTKKKSSSQHPKPHTDNSYSGSTKINQPSKLCTTKRALFQSPDRKHDPTGHLKLTSGASERDCKRVLWSEGGEHNLNGKRRWNDGSMETRKIPRLTNSPTRRPSGSHIPKITPEGNHAIATNVNKKQTKDISSPHKKKFLWAIAEALRKEGIPMNHNLFKPCAALLGNTCKKYLRDLLSQREGGSTSDKMLYLASKYVPGIIQKVKTDMLNKR